MKNTSLSPRFPSSGTPELSALVAWLPLISFMRLRLEGVFTPFVMIIGSLVPVHKWLHPWSCLMLEGEGSS